MDDKSKDSKQKMAKTPAELLAERAKRIKDAYELRVPDRVPIRLNFGYMLARLGGITNQELERDLDRAQALLEKAGSTAAICLG